MSLVSTTILTFDNQTLIVPNSKIWGDVIKNITNQEERRVDMSFHVSYEDDLEHAERTLTAICADHPKVLSEPESLIKVHELGKSSIEFAVRPWVRTEDYWEVYWDLTREVRRRFVEEGLTTPIPRQDIRVQPVQSASSRDEAAKT
jgi:small conductance mechanosensitive channel